MAISVDGFIATQNGDSDWVSDVDIPIFEKKIKEFGCIVVGRKTFEQYQGKLYPVKDVLNIVVTNKTSVDLANNVVFAKSPSEAIKLAESKGFKQILLIGGGTINGSFLKENLIDEIFLDVHPLVLGKGIKLFENYEGKVKVDIVESTGLEKCQILLHYKVIK